MRGRRTQARGGGRGGRRTGPTDTHTNDTVTVAGTSTRIHRSHHWYGYLLVPSLAQVFAGPLCPTSPARQGGGEARVTNGYPPCMPRQTGSACAHAGHAACRVPPLPVRNVACRVRPMPEGQVACTVPHAPRHEVLALKHQRALWHLLHRQQHACAASVRRTCVAVVTLDVLTAARARGAVLRLPHPVGPVEAQLGAAAAADRAVAAEQAARRRVVARRRDRPPLVLRVGATAHVVPKKLLRKRTRPGQCASEKDRHCARTWAAPKACLRPPHPSLPPSCTCSASGHDEHARISRMQRLL
eukprot:357733-Chlamydomonas_euryale.AAC.3